MVESVAWLRAKKAIKGVVPEHSYALWIESLAVSKINDDQYLIACPNTFAKGRIKNQFGAIITKELSEVKGHECSLIFEVGLKPNRRTRDTIVSKEQDLKLVKHHQLSLPNFTEYPITGRILNKKNQFSSFVVGASNKFAYSAALSLASRNQHHPSLYLLSKTGMGKSHLSQAVGQHVLSQYPKARIFYITAEDFTNDMVRAFQNKKIDQFKIRFRKHCDVLLLEDIHFLSGKERTQLELALAIDYLFENDKKLIFTSCYLPNEIPKLSDKLRSRLLSGLLAPIEKPEFKTRVKILEQKAKENGYSIPKDINEYIAGALTDNIRQLESGLIGVAAMSSLLGRPINLTLAEKVVEKLVTKREQLTIDTIKKIVCKNFSLSVSDITSKSRKAAVVRPRQIAMYLTRKYVDESLQVIGKEYNRKHATVLHAVNLVEKEMKGQGEVKNQVDYLSKKIEEDFYLVGS